MKIYIHSSMWPLWSFYRSFSRLLAVSKLMNHLLGLTQSNILTLALISLLTLLVRAECGPR